MKSLGIASFLLVALLGAAQQPAPATDSKPQETPSPAAQPAAAQAPKPPISQTARLNAAKTVYVKKMSGNDIPFNVISNGFDGWAKYQVIGDPAKADLIVEITAPEEHDTGFSVIGGATGYEPNGKKDQAVGTTKSFTVTNIRMSVVDAHTKTVLWGGNESPRSAARKNKSEDNLVEAAQRLFQRFHDRVEPPPQ